MRRAPRRYCHAAAVPHPAALQLPPEPPVRGPRPRYENCEMRTVVLSDGGGAGTPDRTWFRGGEAFAEPQKALAQAAGPGSHPIRP